MDQSNGPNHDLFVKVLAQIEREPSTWRQSTWAMKTDCDTAYCFAGWALELSDIPLQWEEGRRVTAHTAAGLRISEVAARLLQAPQAGGFHWRDEEGDDTSLFYATNSLNDLYQISADILGIDETVLRDKVAAEATA